MTDLDVALFLIKAASVTESAERVVTEGIRTHPELPWGIAANGLADEDSNYTFAVHAVKAAATEGADTS